MADKFCVTCAFSGNRVASDGVGPQRETTTKRSIMEDCGSCKFSDGCPPLGEGWIGCQGYKPGVGIVEQPVPIPNSNPHIVDLVMQDMAARKAVGLKKYGTPLQAHNGRDALIDKYQELLDAVFYARQEIEERDA